MPKSKFRSILIMIVVEIIIIYIIEAITIAFFEPRVLLPLSIPLFDIELFIVWSLIQKPILLGTSVIGLLGLFGILLMLGKKLLLKSILKLILLGILIGIVPPVLILAILGSLEGTVLGIIGLLGLFGILLSIMLLEKLTLKLMLKLISVGIVIIVVFPSLFDVCHLKYDGYMAVAEIKAKEFFFWRYFPTTVTPYPVVISEAHDVNISILKGYKVYRAGKYTGLIPVVDFCLIAVKEGRAFLLPDELNKIILDEKIKIESEDDAFEIAEAYVKLSRGIGTVKILRNASDMIPPYVLEEIRRGEDGKLREMIEEIEKFSKVIKPPKIERKDGEYLISLYTYCDVGGFLDRWLFVIDRNGIKEVRKEEIASRVGWWYGLQ